MKIVGIIPSRMNSKRLPGKALADIRGLPMVIRVFRAAAMSGLFDALFVATDSPEIEKVCRDHGAPVLMTGSYHKNPTSRTGEASAMVEGDYYVMIGGDEPLLLPEDIRRAVRSGISALESGGNASCDAPFVVNAMAVIPTPEEAADPSNIKLACTDDGTGLYASRSPIPYPKERDCRCRKFVSIGIYTKKALDFFERTPPGILEQTEGFDLLRFMEHKKRVLFIEITGRTLSVDTEEDLERVRRILAQQRG